MGASKPEIWVFGDYRNYFQNRVTLQLLGKGKELAEKSGARLCAVVIGRDVDEWVWEYQCHGAEKVYVVRNELLGDYHIDLFTAAMVELAEERRPEIVLIGATSFGRELAPRVAKRLQTGLSADCVDLDIDDGLLVMTAPSFGGNMLAKIVCPQARPQMATVRPGTFKEIPHDDDRRGEVIELPFASVSPKPPRLRLISSRQQPHRGEELERAKVVVCGGRGMGSKKKFKNLHELARLLRAEIGATRPVVYSGWADQEALIGQAGKSVKPQLLFSFGVSGAIQHTAAFSGSEFIIAVNKNPNAQMMKQADVAIVADANQVCTALIRELKKRLER